MSFAELINNTDIIRAISDACYSEPTDIQRMAIPHILAGTDILGCARTGSGKTAAFALPILQRLSLSRPGQGIRVLILAPTRELALQINQCFAEYGKYLPYRIGVLLGGIKPRPQIDMLREGVDILVATPGRLLDLYAQGYVELHTADTFVLDEADRMLDMGFLRPVTRISHLLRRDRQTLMFSATMPKEVLKLAETLLGDYVRVDAAPVSTVATTIDELLYFVDKKNKTELLLDIIADENIPRALVFTRTKHGADKLVRQLNAAGVPSLAIHGNKSQGARVSALERFRDGELRVLVATEIVARGIDIDEMPFVFNYNLPEEAEMYVHRIGRTGRAGHTGKAISFCCADELELLRRIEKLTGDRIPVAEQHRFPMVVPPTATEPPASSNRQKTKKPESHCTSATSHESSLSMPAPIGKSFLKNARGSDRHTVKNTPKSTKFPATPRSSASKPHHHRRKHK